MIRNILGIIAGYAIFAVPAVLLFQISHQNPHGSASLGFKLFTVAYGAFFAFWGGFILQLIAATKRSRMNVILSFIIAAFAVFSLTQSGGSHWTQWFAIFIFAPMSFFGGFLFLRRNSN
ncbi:hypothetical protein GCM10023149_38100 [Mucilaginibacter gynuensis]|uniref:Secreted protein with PEP-CTERM sorting signal n=1 Tax=Mucilaginibacter gynuensis TaxID=1302236 RepID=A0ABP8GZ59_9SPHI